jgi:hypothetical protein
MERRTLLATMLAPIFSRPSQTGFKVGDWLQVVSLPRYTAAWASGQDPDRRNAAWVYRQSLGKRYRVDNVGDDGRPEFEVDQNTAASVGALRFSISIATEHVVRVPALVHPLSRLPLRFCA